MAMYGRDVRLNLMDNGSGQWVGQAFRLENAMVTSK